MSADMTTDVGCLMADRPIDGTEPIGLEGICVTLGGGTLIRYYLRNGRFLIAQPRSKPTLALGVVMPPRTTRRIATSGLTLKLTATDTRAGRAAVALTTIAASADDNLLATTRTQIEPGTGEHRRKVPMSAGFNPR